MLERITQVGNEIYFLWGIGLLGLLLKMITSTYLKSMIKASENMATTRKRSLRIMRQKYENGRSLGINKGSGQAFVEKNVRALKLGVVPLEAWRRSGVALCSIVLLSVGGSFLYYDVSWRGSPEMINFLINAGMVCAFLMFIENIFLVTNKMEILKANIRDYLENLTPLREEVKRRPVPIIEKVGAEESKKQSSIDEVALTEEEISGLLPESEGKSSVNSVYDERDSNEELLNSFLKEFFS